MVKTTYSTADFIKAVKKRLSLVHEVDDTYKVSKNKVVFRVNGKDVILYKDRDGDLRRTVVECDDMFPCAFTNKASTKYVEEEIAKLTNSIDGYFMEKLSYDPVKSSLCNNYEYLKWGLLPFFIKDLTEEGIMAAQNGILYYLNYELFNKDSANLKAADFPAVLLAFTGIEKASGASRLFILIVKDDILTIIVSDYQLEDDKIVTMEQIKKYGFSFKNNREKMFTHNVAKALKEYYKFNPCDISVEIFVEEKTKDEN